MAKFVNLSLLLNYIDRSKENKSKSRNDRDEDRKRKRDFPKTYGGNGSTRKYNDRSKDRYHICS